MSAVDGPSAGAVEIQTGELFGSLWGPYDEALFEASVELFNRRLDLAGFDKGWLQGRSCLDAGCGGGRSSVAMARLGARLVAGMDLGEEGLADASRRAKGLAAVTLQRGSTLAIPFRGASFDLVWCGGVLMHTVDDNQTLDELTRVLKPGGLLYLLVYGTGGLRWPLIQWLRPIAQSLGRSSIENAIERAGLPANKRRTFLDDLFVPRIDFYTWDRLAGMLTRRGYGSVDRWGPQVRLDHEADLAAYRADLESLHSLFAAGSTAADGGQAPLFRAARHVVRATLTVITGFEERVAKGEMDLTDAMDCVIGPGHHRVLCEKVPVA